MEPTDIRTGMTGARWRQQANVLASNMGAFSWMRTEAQVRPHMGFKPEAVGPRGDDLSSTGASGNRTLILARPAGWTEQNLNCTPAPGERYPRQYMDRWDTDSPEQAERLCAGCPALLKCLADALEEEGGVATRSRYLVRGGLTPAGRAALDQGEMAS